MSTRCAAIGLLRFVAERLVEGVADVPAADVAVAGPAEVVRSDVVGADQADRRRAHQEAVACRSAARRGRGWRGS